MRRAHPGYDHLLGFSLPVDRMRALVAESCKTGRPVGDLVRDAIDLLLQRHSGLERFAAGVRELESPAADGTAADRK